jgi:hypothetical protein
MRWKQLSAARTLRILLALGGAAAARRNRAGLHVDEEVFDVILGRLERTAAVAMLGQIRLQLAEVAAVLVLGLVAALVGAVGGDRPREHGG